MSYLETHDSGAEKPLHRHGLLATCKVCFATQEGEVLVRNTTKWLFSLHEYQGDGYSFSRIWLTCPQFLLLVCSRTIIKVISITLLVTKWL